MSTQAKVKNKTKVIVEKGVYDLIFKEVRLANKNRSLQIMFEDFANDQCLNFFVNYTNGSVKYSEREILERVLINPGKLKEDNESLIFDKKSKLELLKELQKNEGKLFACSVVPVKKNGVVTYAQIVNLKES